LNHTSPYTTNALLEQLHGLSQRLTGVDTDKAGSWIGGKLSKPSLDTIGGWLEGRFTKLVTGDNDTAAPTGEETKSRDHPFVGPFAHYSTISSTTPSARSSPQPSFSNFNMPPPRTTSAMDTSSEYPQVPIERSLSAFGYMQQKPGIRSSTPPLSSSQSSPIVNPAESHFQHHDPYGPKSQQSSASDMTETPVHGTWWGSGADNSNRTPTAATFMQVDESAIQPSADGFISLMDSHSFSVGPQQETSGFSLQGDENDGLGLRNSKPKPIELELDPKERESTTPVPKSEPVAPPKAGEDNDFI
jgi:COPII coat assembly protein SEC16